MVFDHPLGSLPSSSSLPTSSTREAPLSSTKAQTSVLKEWATQHKIRQEIRNSKLAPLVYVIKGIAALVLGALALVFSVFILAYNAGMTLKEKFTVSRKPQSPVAAVRRMKKQEEADKLSTMKKVLNNFKDIQHLSPQKGAKQLTKDLQTRLKDPQLEKNRIARHMLRELSKREPFNPAWIKALGDPEIVKHLPVHSDGQNISSEFSDALEKKYSPLHKEGILSLDWKEFLEQAQKSTIDPKKVEQEIKEFEKSLTQLLKILHNSKIEDDPTSANRELIAALRHALSSPVYQALKEDPTNSSVKFLHRLASDIWNKAPSMDAYCEVGASILRKMKIQDREEEIGGSDLAKHLDDSHRLMSQLHFTDHGLDKVSYALTHPNQFLGAMASEGGAAREIASLVGRDVYDSHGTLSNNPSLQGTTILQLEAGGTAQVRNCYGGSPTIGDHHIAPEFEAAIQAAENNQLCLPTLRDPNIPMMVNYNNLQNLDKKGGEGPRSRTIMLLNEKYPLSFSGATFSKDSHFYMMKDEDKPWEGTPTEFGEIMKKQLARSFDPKEKGHGFYFHGSYEKWEAIFKEVIESANVHFEELREQQSDLYESLGSQGLRGAYQEYVYTMLNSVIEMESIQTLRNRGIDDPSIMVITACKENIDRGGMENTKYLYNRLGTTQEGRLSLIMGAMHSRALSARDRIILAHRMPQILDYMKTTSPKEFQDRQRDLFKSLDYPILNSTYTPHLKPKPVTTEH